jgi:hypothetical protein
MTYYTCDGAGRLSKVSGPQSGGQSIRPATSYEYFDSGWTKKSSNPFGIATSYEYKQLGEQTARTLTCAGGDASRTQALPASGTGTDSFTWKLAVPSDGSYQVYVQYPPPPPPR